MIDWVVLLASLVALSLWCQYRLWCRFRVARKQLREELQKIRFAGHYLMRFVGLDEYLQGFREFTVWQSKDPDEVPWPVEGEGVFSIRRLDCPADFWLVAPARPTCVGVELGQPPSFCLDRLDEDSFSGALNGQIKLNAGSAWFGRLDCKFHDFIEMPVFGNPTRDRFGGLLPELRQQAASKHINQLDSSVGSLCGSGTPLWSHGGAISSLKEDSL